MKFQDFKQIDRKTVLSSLSSRMETGHVRKTLAAVGVFVGLLVLVYAFLAGTAPPDRQDAALILEIENRPRLAETITPPATESPLLQTGPADSSRYHAPFDLSDRRPRIGLIIKDLGLEDEITKKAILELPPGISLAFSPYAKEREFWIDQAIQARREVLLGIPMEPLSFPDIDPGPLALFNIRTRQQNLDSLDALTGEERRNIGFINFFGNSFLSEESQRRSFVDWVRNQDALFIEARLDSKNTGVDVLAMQIALDYAAVDAPVDTVATTHAIVSRLRQLEHEAREAGFALAVASPYPVTIEILKQWAAELEAKGIALAPVSATLNRNIHRP